MKLGFLIAIAFAFSSQSVTATVVCPTTTYTVPVNECPLLNCVVAPTITYTTTQITTSTRHLLCPPHTVGIDQAKRADPDTYTCTPTYTTKYQLPTTCSKCPTATAASSTVVTAHTTVTTYRTCGILPTTI